MKRYVFYCACVLLAGGCHFKRDIQKDDASTDVVSVSKSFSVNQESSVFEKQIVGQKEDDETEDIVIERTDAGVKTTIHRERKAHQDPVTLEKSEAKEVKKEGQTKKEEEKKEIKKEKVKTDTDVSSVVWKIAIGIVSVIVLGFLLYLKGWKL